MTGVGGPEQRRALVEERVGDWLLHGGCGPEGGGCLRLLAVGVTKSEGTSALVG